jgi:hypothetical protein
MTTHWKTLLLINMNLLATAACLEPLDDKDDEIATAEVASELSSSTLVGKIVAYATTDGSNNGPRQTFGPGIYRGNANELASVGNDLIRLLELGPAMRVRACKTENPTPSTCSYFENLTASNQTFSILSGTSRLDVRPLAVAYRNTSFGGIAQGFEIGRHETGRSQLSTVGNDTISSVRLAPGLTARLCSDNPETTTGGHCQTLSASATSLTSAVDNSTSWIEIKPVTVGFRDASLTGTSQRFGFGEFVAAELTVLGNDTMTSVLVPEGVVTRACSDNPNTTTGGRCGTFAKTSLQLSSSLDNSTSWLENRHAVIMAPLNEEGLVAGSTPAAGIITLRALAFSPVDGELTGASLRWSSSRDGFLGTGKTLQVQLSNTGCTSAKHVITLEATDSEGTVQETQREVYVDVVC